LPGENRRTAGRIGEVGLAAALAVRLRPVSHEDDMHLISQE
jgi:hypothetical protein